jgi:hypothetical protein
VVSPWYQGRNVVIRPGLPVFGLDLMDPALEF